MRKIARIMGMPVSIDIPLARNAKPFAAAFDLLRDIDQLYSPYKLHSDTSKIQRGELKPKFYSNELPDIVAACAQFERLTDGFFSATYNGTFDPSGYVKGWAIQQVATLLQQHGFSTYLINIGGDIIAASSDEHTWRLGLQHPNDPTAVIGTVQAKNLALATSGSYARGNHIFDPHTKKQARDIISATVIGPDIITADVFATTVCAMGLQKGLEFLNSRPGYEALLITPDLSAYTTHGFTQPKTQTARL